jgi:hypothetical protein
MQNSHILEKFLGLHKRKTAGNNSYSDIFQLHFKIEGNYKPQVQRNMYQNRMPRMASKLSDWFLQIRLDFGSSPHALYGPNH